MFIGGSCRPFKKNNGRRWPGTDRCRRNVPTNTAAARSGRPDNSAFRPKWTTSVVVFETRSGRANRRHFSPPVVFDYFAYWRVVVIRARRIVRWRGPFRIYILHDISPPVPATFRKRRTLAEHRRRVIVVIERPRSLLVTQRTIPIELMKFAILLPRKTGYDRYIRIYTTIVK